MFCECAELEGREPLGQGDVIEWLDGKDDPWRQFGLIVTADCDLAHDKHAGILSYVPILYLRDYLALFYFPRRIQAEIVKLDQQARDMIRRLQEELRPEFGDPVSDDVVDQMLRRPPNEVVDALRASGASEETLVRVMTALQRCADTLASPSHDGGIQAFVEARAALGADTEKARDSLMREVQGAVRSLPGDGLFLGSLSPEHRAGYVAYLRVLRETAEDMLALRQSQLGREGVFGRRISRLQSPYIFHLTQRLSSVFSAIGLPVEYEEHRADLVAGQYAPTS